MLLLMQLLPAEHGIGVTTSIFHVVLVLSFKNLIYTEMMQKILSISSNHFRWVAGENCKTLKNQRRIKRPSLYCMWLLLRNFCNPLLLKSSIAAGDES